MILFSKPFAYRRALVLVPLLVALGCGRTAEVTGKATLNGKPITSGSVTILAADSLTYSGNLDENGVYRILNVARGSAKVSVASPDPAALSTPHSKTFGKLPSQRVKPAASPATKPANWFPLPAQYADFETSELRLDVKGGVNNFDIPLVGTKPKK